MKISYNTIMRNPSLCDGTGYRMVVFLQGCDLYCKNCQNKDTWDINKGHLVEAKELADLIRDRSFNKQITISGGEPLMQKDAVLELIELLPDYDICLYTGHDIIEVPQEILDKVHYIKYGPFIEEMKTTVKPFVGSSNQVFMEVKHEASK